MKTSCIRCGFTSDNVHLFILITDEKLGPLCRDAKRCTARQNAPLMFDDVDEPIEAAAAYYPD